jgi:hypothetical protein
VGRKLALRSTGKAACDRCRQSELHFEPDCSRVGENLHRAQSKLARWQSHHGGDARPGFRRLVLRKVLNMTAEQAHAFVLAHRDAIMVEDSDDAVLRFVSTSPGAIGVVDLYSLTQDVNVMKIDGKLPVEQGYLLRGN